MMCANPIVLLEHLNINIPDKTQGKTFYLDALGCAEDPRAESIMKRTQDAGGTMLDMIWANQGLQQIHLPIGEPEDPIQIVRGVVGLSFPNLKALECRLSGVEKSLSGTEFDWNLERCGLTGENVLAITCPFGNRFNAHAASTSTLFGPLKDIEPGGAHGLPGERSLGLGIRYVQFSCPRGTAYLICAFYRKYFAARTEEASDEGSHRIGKVFIGYHQALLFRETDDPLPKYDGHHIALYISNFNDSYTRVQKDGLNWNNPRFPHLTYETLELAVKHCEFRVLSITHPEKPSEILFTLEHEI
ncbi:hypothetical protein CYMTET_34641, partial [Cymbomonas tetramitiformis]